MVLATTWLKAVGPEGPVASCTPAEPPAPMGAHRGSPKHPVALGDPGCSLGWGLLHSGGVRGHRGLQMGDSTHGGPQHPGGPTWGDKAHHPPQALQQVLGSVSRGDTGETRGVTRGVPQHCDTGLGDPGPKAGTLSLHPSPSWARHPVGPLRFTQHPTRCTQHPTTQTLQPAPRTLGSAPHTQRPTPWALRRASRTRPGDPAGGKGPQGLLGAVVSVGVT